MNSETLARWMRALEECRVARDRDGDAIGYDVGTIDELRAEIQRAWADAVRRECA